MSISKENEKKNVLSDINIGNINIFDDVLIKSDDFVYPGWVFDKNNKYITILYSSGNCLLEAKFKIERPLDRTEITENNKTLILKRHDV